MLLKKSKSPRSNPSSRNPLKLSPLPMLTREESSSPRKTTSASGTLKSSLSLSWSSTMTSPVATSCVHPRSTSGSRSQPMQTPCSRQRASTTATSQCSSLRPPSTKKRTMLLASLQKSLGWPKQARVKCLSQLLSAPPQRPLCTQRMQSGLDPIETSHCSSTSGPMSSDGSSSTQLPS